jgi:regulator of RNase E activity RraB
VNFPDDDDGDELRRIAEGGSDMALPMPVEFTVVFPERAEAEAFSGLVASLGYRPTVEPEDDGWCCTCTRDMVATHPAIVAAQDSLAAAAEKFEGVLDGWGSFGNRPPK